MNHVVNTYRTLAPEPEGWVAADADGLLFWGITKEDAINACNAYHLVLA
jgi:hypothetical protein